jgi:hypothetical protein
VRTEYRRNESNEDPSSRQSAFYFIGKTTCPAIDDAL